MFVCPVTHETSVAWTRMAMNDFESPDAEAHSAADRMSAAYRRYLKNSGIHFGVIR